MKLLERAAVTIATPESRKARVYLAEIPQVNQHIVSSYSPSLIQE